MENILKIIPVRYVKVNGMHFIVIRINKSEYEYEVHSGLSYKTFKWLLSKSSKKALDYLKNNNLGYERLS